MGLFDWFTSGNNGLANVAYSNILPQQDYSALPSSGGFTTSPNVWTGFNGDTNTLLVNRPTNAPLMDATTNANNGFLGLGSDTWAGIGAGIQGLSGLANAYLGYKNYQLAQDQFKFQKGLANRNLANQAKIINNTYDNAAQVAAGMIGGKDAQGNYGVVNQSTVDRYANKAKEKHVDGSPI